MPKFEIPVRLSGKFHDQLDRIERNTDVILRRLNRMAIDEAAFNEALADFVGVLDDTLETIQSKLDSLGTPTDFTEELATLDAAKQRLNEFVASNTGTAGGGTDETTPPEEVPPGEGGAGVGTGG